MKAVILMGGFGTPMRPHSRSHLKPIAQVCAYIEDVMIDDSFACAGESLSAGMLLGSLIGENVVIRGIA